MAKLDKMPSEAIVRGLKKTLDFYYWMGIPCVRSWPRPPSEARSLEVQATWPAFIYAAQEWKNLSPVVQNAYTKLATNSKLTGRDLQMRAYLQGLYRYPTP